MILLLPQRRAIFLIFAHWASASGLQKARFVSPQTRIITPATKPTQRAHEGQPLPHWIASIMDITEAMPNLNLYHGQAHAPAEGGAFGYCGVFEGGIFRLDARQGKAKLKVLHHV